MCSPRTRRLAITQRGRSLTLTNECNQDSCGDIIENNSVNAYDWNLTANGTQIRFSNGTIWGR